MTGLIAGVDPTPITVVTGMAFEARIAAGPGVVTLTGRSGDALTRDLDALVARGCRGLVSFGIAGGLARDLKAGDCIVARSIVTAHGRRDADPRWSAQLLKAIPGAIHADIAGVDAPASSVRDKELLGRSAGAVDMESARAILAAVARDIPFVALRVIADPSHRSLPPAALLPILASGEPDLAAVLRSIAQLPSQLPALIRVALDASVARASLRRVRRFVGPSFGWID